MLDNKGFDLWAEGYDKSVNLSDEDNDYPFAGYKDVLNTIYNYIRKKNIATILDIGFGTGVLTKKLYDDGYDICGIDFSEKMIEISREKMPYAKLLQYDFSKGIPEELEDQEFDFIISTYALHHLDDIEKIRFLNKLLNLLSRNGMILIGDVSFETRQMHNKCRKECGDGWDDEEFYLVFEDIKESFPNAEFTQISHCAGILKLSNNYIDKRTKHDNEVFTYKITKDKKVFIYWNGKHVTTLSSKKSEDFISNIEAADSFEEQLIMAKATGHFKHGNEKERKNKGELYD